MIRVITLLITITLCTGDPMDPPNINSQTLEQYLNASTDPLIEDKIRKEYYLDSLNRELLESIKTVTMH